MKTRVLGLGNTLLQDEGIGVYVIQALQSGNSADQYELIDGGTLSFTLAHYIEDADQLIIVDATELKQPPGTVACFENDAMDAFVLGNRKRSVHEVGLMDLMAIARLNERWPSRRALVAIQPDSLDWGDEPTAAVKEAIPTACQHIERLVAEWTA